MPATLITCPTCSHRVDRTAKACPSCGRRSPGASSGRQMLAGLAVLALIAIAIVVVLNVVFA